MNRRYVRTNSGFCLPGFLSFTKTRDLKRLNRYLIAIHQAVDFEEITAELSGCINDIFDHQFFGLAIQVKDKIMVWVEPSVFKGTIEDLIKEDFCFDGEVEIHPVHSSGRGFINERILRNSLFGKEFNGKNFKAKLYILPGRKLIGKYHEEIINDMVTGLENAVSSSIRLRSLEDAASIDALTNCYNRRELDRKLDEQFSFSRRYGKNFSLIMFDIDFFKNLNDTYGHDAGDQVLREISSRIKNIIRAEDTIFRYGGEEFVVILPETDEESAAMLANRLRREISDTPFVLNGDNVFVTSSFGVSSFMGSNNPEEILRTADKLLYKAKNSGRNRVMSNVIRLCRNAVPFS
ncbi:MAG: GGDEF domain-containing protein [Desulfobacteraceae bacterium]|nr:GGDEF domain-containing protein [Desulfobacteraceae bacterium]MCB9494133.1 GGDEF domain-containing protein [Desulfobacteraceae bacterium]